MKYREIRMFEVGLKVVLQLYDWFIDDYLVSVSTMSLRKYLFLQIAYTNLSKVFSSLAIKDNGVNLG
jgi:hypothetical protein